MMDQPGGVKPLKHISKKNPDQSQRVANRILNPGRFVYMFESVCVCVCVCVGVCEVVGGIEKERNQQREGDRKKRFLFKTNQYQHRHIQSHCLRYRTGDSLSGTTKNI